MGGNAGGAEVLVVDDSQELGEVIAELLDAAGYRTRYVSTGRAALDAVRERRPALVLTDGLMPGMNGLELLTALRSELAPPVPPVIVISGFPALEQEARARGTADFLHKPCDAKELIAAVERVLANRPADRGATERARLRAMRDRQKVSKAAAAALAAIERLREQTARRAPQLAAWLSAYFGFGSATLVACRPDEIRRLAQVSAPGATPIDDWEAANPFLQDIAETSSSLLVPDTDAYAALASLARTGGIRFFAGVPVLVDRTAIGALALFDARPQPFSGDDLALLEHVGQLGGAWLLAHAEGAAEFAPELLLDEAGYLNPTSFEAFLSTELHLAGQTGAAFALAIADFKIRLEDVPTRHPEGDGVRLAIGRLGPQRLAVFKRHECIDRATDVLDSVLDVGDGSALARAAVLALEPMVVPLVDGRVALNIAERGMLTSREQGGTIRLRITLQHPSARARAVTPAAAVAPAVDPSE